MRLRSFAAAALLVGSAVLGFSGCTESEPTPRLKGQVKLTLLHTSDIHSRLFPYDVRIGPVDSKLGLGTNGVIARVGGAARISHILGRERARADRVLHLDGGDCFQGAPVFNFFNGEAEIRALSEMGTDMMIVANHEFDKGPQNLGTQLQNWATFPVLAANYKFDNAETPGSAALSRVTSPFTTFNLDGLKVGVVGYGNLSSLSSLFEQPNRVGILPLNTSYITQFYVDLLRPLVDVVVFVTHLGLEADQQMIESTEGIDIILGGHNHIVLQPPKVIEDCQKQDENGNHYIEVLSGEAQEAGSDPKFVRRRCEPRKVILAHSGAFAKYVGRLDAVLSNDPADTGKVDELNGYEVIEHDYKLLPVTEDVPEDPHVRNLLTPYRRGLDALTNLDLLVGYAPDGASRVAPAGGDSALGNMVATAMWLRQGIQTDFALTNTQGIRTDMVPGPVSLEQFYNIFPFDNAITKMQLSGIEVQRMFDFTARRAASRACASQVQIAGARVIVNCTGCDRPDLTGPCGTDDDCPTNGKCDKQAGKCLPQPCAEAIYVGRDQDKPCTESDQATTCGSTLPKVCDTTRLEADGKGRCGIPIKDISSYELATSDYLAGGGSGFSILKANTTQFNTRVQQRDALIDYLRQGRPCGWSKDAPTEDGLVACVNDGDCAGQDGFVCSCAANSAPNPDGTCATTADCNPSEGRCVLKQCRDDVAAFQRKTCDTARTPEAKADCETTIGPCEVGGETCKFLACVDDRLGNFTDGRQVMVGR
jgi:5'-nucleotidase / UDP-sugar diphosphatase